MFWKSVSGRLCDPIPTIGYCLIGESDRNSDWKNNQVLQGRNPYILLYILYSHLTIGVFLMGEGICRY